MENFFKAFAASKIPSLLLLSLMYGTGTWLLVNSENNPAATFPGQGLLLSAVILSMITFVDYRNKEHIENLLKQYQNALDNISKTHSILEQKNQDGLSRTKATESRIGNEGEYSINALQGTSTQ